ncbi:sugar isomerase domain-containing protein [Demequina sediminicola]|uniref:sugar isomerase domain-containing protein n=1 Tax=Demequina sediminicola TaxID=1095026 RepID=UPI000781F899|nr:sugar isomerase domain-containing protein [Demequina sediminicola]
MTSETRSDTYLQTVHHLIDRIAERNGVALSTAAGILAKIADDGRIVHTYGAGHSLAAVLETFYRAGGPAFVRPLWHEHLLPLVDARGSTVAEREPGFGTSLFDRVPWQSGDAVLIFSTSGVNPAVVEVAQRAQEAGLPVIAVTSKSASMEAPRRANRKLYEIADVVLDTCVPPGDAMWPLDSARTAPGSSMANVLCWNLLEVELLARNPNVPLWRSANTSETSDTNDDYMERYGHLVETLDSGHSTQQRPGNDS